MENVYKIFDCNKTSIKMWIEKDKFIKRYKYKINLVYNINNIINNNEYK